MSRTTKSEQARQAANNLARLAFEAGFDHFREDPEADMTTIHRRASNIYPDSKAEALAYAEGYLARRLELDAYRKEQSQ